MAHSRRTTALEPGPNSHPENRTHGSAGSGAVRNGREDSQESPLALMRSATPTTSPSEAPARNGRLAPPAPLEAGPLEAVEPDWNLIQPKSFYARRGKRMGSLALLLVTLPLALLLALPIALVNWALFRDYRRILFEQERVGRRGQTFHIYKFRTMREAPDTGFASWKDESDRLRVTGFGRFLRNTHLDELPQLFNVLRGDMDFIGPRPEMVEIDGWAVQRIDGFRERNALAPGITGLAQITHGYAGMDPEAYRKKLAADLEYKDRLSLRLDLAILVRTVAWMLRGRGWRRRGANAAAKSSASA